MKKSEKIAWDCYNANTPIDYAQIDYIKRNYTEKEKLEWAKDNVIYFADPGASQRLITMAAKELLFLLF